MFVAGSQPQWFKPGFCPKFRDCFSTQYAKEDSEHEIELNIGKIRGTRVMSWGYWWCHHFLCIVHQGNKSHIMRILLTSSLSVYCTSGEQESCHEVTDDVITFCVLYIRGTRVTSWGYCWHRHFLCIVHQGNKSHVMRLLMMSSLSVYCTSGEQESHHKVTSNVITFCVLYIRGTRVMSWGYWWCHHFLCIVHQGNKSHIIRLLEKHYVHVTYLRERIRSRCTHTLR